MKELAWKATGDPQRISGIVVNVDVEGNPFFQARFSLPESRKVNGVLYLRMREILGKPVYVGKFGNAAMYVKHPDLILAAQMVRILWPTIRAVTDEFSTVRVDHSRDEED